MNDKRFDKAVKVFLFVTALAIVDVIILIAIIYSRLTTSPTPTPISMRPSISLAATRTSKSSYTPSPTPPPSPTSLPSPTLSPSPTSLPSPTILPTAIAPSPVSPSTEDRTFYCSNTGASSGNGSEANPWACSNADQLRYVIYDLICTYYGGGELYSFRADRFAVYNIAYSNQNSQWVCTFTYNYYPRYGNYGGVPPYIVQQKIETTSLEPLETDSKAGELNVDYPAWIEPNTSNNILVKINIPLAYLGLSTKNFSIMIIPDTTSANRMSRGPISILVGEYMVVDLSSSTLKIIPQTAPPSQSKVEFSDVDPNQFRNKIWQRINLTTGNPTTWLWSVIAPETEGRHDFYVNVGICEKITRSCDNELTLVGSILVAKPTSTPTLTLPPTFTHTPTSTPTLTLTSTPTSTPTSTLTPTSTPTPTPTPSLAQKIGTQLVNNFPVVLGAILTFIIGLFTILANIQNNKRSNEIERLKLEQQTQTAARKQAALEAEIARLKSIKWWQFWRR